VINGEGWRAVALPQYHSLEVLDNWVIDTALRIQTRLAELMPNTGNYGWYVAGAVVLIAVAVMWALRDTGSRDGTRVSDPGPIARDRSHNSDSVR